MTACHTSSVDPEQRLLEKLREHCGQEKFEVLRHAVPVLTGLLAEAHDHPTAHFYPAVRETVLEHCPMHHAQFTGLPDAAEIEQCVGIVCQVMEEMRCAAVQSGSWSDTPCPPQFFG